MALPTTGGYLGYQRSNTAATDFGAITFAVRTILARVRTSTLVSVVGVANDGDVAPVGFVDIQPLVNQLSGAGVAVPHGTIYKCPYLRVQGGANAIILDPQVGDIGIAVFADRDISSATANKGQANPGSARRFDMADALYLGGVLNGTPTQFVQFSTAGIQITSPTAIDLNAPTIALTAPTVTIAASTGVTMTTPTFTLNGNQVTNGTTTTTELDTPTANVSTSLMVAGKDLGPNHEHILSGGGHTLGVV